MLSRSVLFHLGGGMRGVRVRSSCSLSLCPDTVTSLSQHPQRTGAPGSRGVVWLQGVLAVLAWLQVPPWHLGMGRTPSPPEARGWWGLERRLEPLPLRRGQGTPEDPKTQTQQRPDTACFIARLSQPLTELGENAQIINNLTYNK